MSSDPFAQYRKKSILNKTQEDPFSKYRKNKQSVDAEEQKKMSTTVPTYNDEDLDREIERNQAQLTSRFIERIFGMPGDIYGFIPEGIRKLNPLNPLHKHLPSSQKLREFSEKASLGYTKPKSKSEEKAGEFIGDVASFSIGNPAKSILGATARTVGIPLAGLLAKEGIEKIAPSNKTTQEYAKLGTMLLLDLWGLRHGAGGSVSEFGKKRLEEARKAIPSKALADVGSFEQSLNRLDKSLGRGITNPSTKEAQRVIGDIRNNIQSGKMEASLFPEMRQRINGLIDNLKGFSIDEPTRRANKETIHHLNDIKKSIISAGNRWGRKNSPEFQKAWREGNEALAVNYKSHDLSNFFSNKVNKSLFKNPLIRFLFGYHAIHNPIGALGYHGAGKLASSLVKPPFSLAYRFLKSPVLRKRYEMILKEASKSNVSAVESNLKKLEHEMTEEKIE